jgi:outer membrane beta-barrel protein
MSNHMNRRLSLAGAIIGATVMALTGMAHAQVPVQAATPEQVIEPQIDRREIKVPRIDVDDIEIGVFSGILSIENFGAKSVTGVRLAYHVTEDLFVEGTYGNSIVSDEFFRERAFPITGFRQAEEELTYYNISLGYNVLPGEIFIGKSWAMASAFYVIGGIGTTSFAQENFSTFNFGVGYRVLVNDWFALHFDMRDHVFDSDLLGKNQSTNNFETHVGMTVFF